MALFPNEQFDLLLVEEKDDDNSGRANGDGDIQYEEIIQKFSVEIEENWFISFVHSEYLGGAGGHHHVGLPLQRSASLNYALAHYPHNQIPTSTSAPQPPASVANSSRNISGSNRNCNSNKNVQRRVPMSPSSRGNNRSGFSSANMSPSSTTTDVDNQIRIIETQFDESSKNGHHHNSIIITRHDDSEDEDEAVLRELQASIILDNDSKKSVGDSSSSVGPVVVPPSNVDLANNSVIADANSNANSTSATCRKRQLENASPCKSKNQPHKDDLFFCKLLFIIIS